MVEWKRCLIISIISRYDKQTCIARPPLHQWIGRNVLEKDHTNTDLLNKYDHWSDILLVLNFEETNVIAKEVEGLITNNQDFDFKYLQNVGTECRKRHDESLKLECTTVQYRKCPYSPCARSTQKLCGKIECIGCTNASAKNLETSALKWCQISMPDPRLVIKGNKDNYIMICSSHSVPHSWETNPNKLSKTSCPFPGCAINRPTHLCGDADCRSCFDYSALSLQDLLRFTTTTKKWLAMSSERFEKLVFK